MRLASPCTCGAMCGSMLPLRTATSSSTNFTKLEKFKKWSVRPLSRNRCRFRAKNFWEGTRNE